MIKSIKPPLPTLTPFYIPNIPFAVVDPRELPENIQAAFEQFIAGSATPHPIYVYSHDYERFCMLIRQSKLSLE
ncbi:hypothetical protein L4D76_23580 [Photobacterium sagamiensis]|uniref:hypothetical protein n=1 Tax=Photobacterium sagamiensis TaxID=2910241 RepID=UPI003D0B53E7